MSRNSSMSGSPDLSPSISIYRKEPLRGALNPPAKAISPQRKREEVIVMGKKGGKKKGGKC